MYLFSGAPVVWWIWYDRTSLSLDTWICQSVRCDSRTSLPWSHPSTRGKRSKEGQWLAADCTHGLCLLPFNLPKLRVPSPPLQCYCLSHRLAWLRQGSGTAQGRAPSRIHSAGRLIQRSRRNHHTSQLLCVAQEALALPFCCPSLFFIWVPDLLLPSPIPLSPGFLPSHSLRSSRSMGTKVAEAQIQGHSHGHSWLRPLMERISTKSRQHWTEAQRCPGSSTKRGSVERWQTWESSLQRPNLSSSLGYTSHCRSTA